jgi:hypothetical protein
MQEIRGSGGFKLLFGGEMRKTLLCLTNLCMATFLTLPAYAQDTPKAEEKRAAAATTPVKVVIVCTEFEGEKKVKSLPYTVYVNAPNAEELKPGWTKVRVGSRVPVFVGNNQMQYMDIGTNIDARASYTSEGRLLLYLVLERSWVEGDVAVPMEQPGTQGADAHTGQFREPIMRQYKFDLDLRLREGQTTEANMATDPLSGRVLKAEVSFTLVR